jgi:hypothetical protein
MTRAIARVSGERRPDASSDRPEMISTSILSFCGAAAIRKASSPPIAAIRSGPVVAALSP